ncbi:unnamed protein product, partial [Schistosoma intercalatum]
SITVNIRCFISMLITIVVHQKASAEYKCSCVICLLKYQPLVNIATRHHERTSVCNFFTCISKTGLNID